MLSAAPILYKIGQRSSPTCRTCLLNDDYIIMECSKFAPEQDTLFNELYRFLPASFLFQQIIFSNNAEVLKLLFNFLINYNSS
ncbi:hypothetical protein O3M35_002588 [Rhynocoris fuscipes]|uniref:Maturase K n=1 Tax=Rhynocoris fuscipes TaxID=488301 RepID=A0AAW1CMK7_9HEMI